MNYNFGRFFQQVIRVRTWKNAFMECSHLFRTLVRTPGFETLGLKLRAPIRTQFVRIRVQRLSPNVSNPIFCIFVYICFKTSRAYMFGVLSLTPKVLNPGLNFGVRKVFVWFLKPCVFTCFHKKHIEKNDKAAPRVRTLAPKVWTPAPKCEP